MPIIYSYPSKISPSSGDLLIISDVTASNQTKKITIGDLRDPLDVVDTIIPGDGISVSSPTGDVTISNTGVLDFDVATVNSFGIPLAAVDVGGGTTKLFSYRYIGGSNVGFVPPGGNSSTFLKGNGTWAVPTKASPSLPLNGVQYRDNNGNFAAASSLIFEEGNGKLIVGDETQDIYGIVEIQSDNDSGAQLRIQGGSGFYTTIIGSENDTASYIITLPVAGPGGNDKILQSNSNGDLSWIDTPSGGGSAGVSSFTNSNGTYVSAVTENSAATGAVSVGSIDLSAINGTATKNTRFLSKDNTWSVPSIPIEGFNTYSIYSAGFKVGNPTAGNDRTIIRQTVCETDCEIGYVDFFRFNGETPVSIFVYRGVINNTSGFALGDLILQGSQASPGTAGTTDPFKQNTINTIEFVDNTLTKTTAKIEAGTPLVIVFSFLGNEPGLFAGDKHIDDANIARFNDQFMVPSGFDNANPPDPELAAFLDGTGASDPTTEGLALHFYNIL